MMKALVSKMALVGVVIGAVGGVTACSDREYEREHGIAFLRHSNALNDAVAHEGTLHVGEDDCLYVTLDAVTYWAALAPGDEVDGQGVTSGQTRALFGTPTTFGRVTDDVGVPAEFREKCTGASDVYNVGF